MCDSKEEMYCCICSYSSNTELENCPQLRNEVSPNTFEPRHWPWRLTLTFNYMGALVMTHGGVEPSSPIVKRQMPSTAPADKGTGWWPERVPASACSLNICVSRPSSPRCRTGWNRSPVEAVCNQQQKCVGPRTDVRNVLWPCLVLPWWVSLSIWAAWQTARWRDRETLLLLCMLCTASQNNN